MKPFVKYLEELSINNEGPFPAKIFLSKEDSDSASVKLGTVEKGKTLNVHIHEDVDQIEYYLKGKATMFLESIGEIELREGAFTYIPKGVKHGISAVSESLTLLTVFVPPLF